APAQAELRPAMRPWRSTTKTPRPQGFRRILFFISWGLGVLVVSLGAYQTGIENPPIVQHKFTFARIQYHVPAFSYWGPVGAGNGPPWSHDWPKSEEHLMKIMAEVTKLDVNGVPHLINFDNDEVFKFPIAYLCEVQFLDLSEKEIERMRQYLLRGGFL